MSRLLMLIVLMLSASSAWAEWTAVGGNPDTGLTTYIDFSTIRRTGNLVKFWVLNDFKTMQTSAVDRFLSAKIQYQYDCQEEQYRELAWSLFSKNMGDGNVVYSDSAPLKWKPVEPGSVAETSFKIVCDKKREADEAKGEVAAERERQQQEAVRSQREADEAKRKAEAAARAAQQKLIDDWRVRIQAKIKSRVIVPPNVEGNPEARFEVVLLPGGEVLSATLRKSSGNPAYDAAVERAIMAAQPLPVPTDSHMFTDSFRELNLSFRPRD